LGIVYMKGVLSRESREGFKGKGDRRYGYC
jgi:hypothetical protein